MNQRCASVSIISAGLSISCAFVYDIALYNTNYVTVGTTTLLATDCRCILHVSLVNQLMVRQKFPSTHHHHHHHHAVLLNPGADRLEQPRGKIKTFLFKSCKEIFHLKLQPFTSTHIHQGTHVPPVFVCCLNVQPKY